MTLAIEAGTDPEPAVNGALPADVIARLKTEFDQGKGCQHCGGRHARACPRVKRFRFHPTGALAEVVFWPEGKWSDEHVIWPEDLTSE